MGEGTIAEAQAELTESVIDLPGVTGTAIGLCGGEPCIKVYVSTPSPQLRERIPDRFRGYPVEVEVTGTFRARDTTG